MAQTPSRLTRQTSDDPWEVTLIMFGSGTDVFSILEITRNYPDQWIAVVVTEIDDDGFAAAGEVLVHDSDERAVWSAVRLGNTEDPVYVFHTGSRHKTTAAA